MVRILLTLKRRLLEFICWKWQQRDWYNWWQVTGWTTRTVVGMGVYKIYRQTSLVERKAKIGGYETFVGNVNVKSRRWVIGDESHDAVHCAISFFIKHLCWYETKTAKAKCSAKTKQADWYSSSCNHPISTLKRMLSSRIWKLTECRKHPQHTNRTSQFVCWQSKQRAFSNPSGGMIFGHSVSRTRWLADNSSCD